MDSYLVTGGAGFIGSHLVEKLLEKRIRVINVDNFNDFYNLNVKIRNILESVNKIQYYNELNKINPTEKKLKKLKELVDSDVFRLEILDINNKEGLQNIFKVEKIKCIINLAALAGVRPSIEDPLEYENTNIRGYLNLLDIAKDNLVLNFVQASSSSVYGNNKKIPFEEIDSVDFPISPYAATKKSGEILGHVYHHLYNIDMVQLRFFTVYGPRQRPDLAIHKFTKLIYEDKEIPFYGDGNTKRDYTYIDDIIDGILKSIDYVINNAKVYEVFNLGENEVVSLIKMINTIEDKTGIKAKLNKLPKQPGDVDITYANINKAKEILGYNPQTKFEEGIEKFIKWYNQLI